MASAVSKLHTDMQRLRKMTAAEKKAEASMKKGAADEKAALASIQKQEQAIIDQFLNASAPLDPATEQKLLGKIFDLGAKSAQTRTRFDGQIAKSKKAMAGDKKAMGGAKKSALRDLKPAEYGMSLKDTNRVRKELGLKALSKPLRRAAVSNGAQKILAVARKHLGFHEGAGNNNPFSHDMGRPSEAWCADFVSYCVKHAGLHTVNTASAQGIADQLAAKGRWKGRHNPQPGDAVTFNWSGSHGWADHVGMVEKVFRRNGQLYIQTIEGNSSDMVHRKVYPANSQFINGFGRLA